MGKPSGIGVDFSRDVGINIEIITGTDSSQALTINSRYCRITSSTNDLGAKTTEAITLTNNKIKANSMVFCSVKGGGAGDPVIGIVTPAAGSVVITTLNADPTNTCNAVYVLDVFVVNPA